MNNVFIAGLLTVAMILSSAPEYSRDEIPIDIPSNTVCIANGPVKWTKTFVTGDADDDQKTTISDVVLLEQYIASDGYYGVSPRFDLNFDGIIDSFDTVLMRQLIINPDSATKQTYSINIVNSAKEKIEYGEVFEDSSAMVDYLNTFITDSSEIKTYTDKYTDEFFNENNLILMPFYQKYGKGVLYKVDSIGRMPDGSDSDVFVSMVADYFSYRPLYAISNTMLLVQSSVPKDYFHAGEIVTAYDPDYIENMSACSFKSPDGKKELYITQDTMEGLSDIRVFMKLAKNKYQALTFLTAYGDKPIAEEGEWISENVYSNGLTYSIEWHDDHIIIDHRVKDTLWECVYIALNEDDIRIEEYTKT